MKGSNGNTNPFNQYLAIKMNNDPKNGVDYCCYNYSIASRKDDEMDDSIEYFSHAIGCNPHKAAYYQELGYVYFCKGINHYNMHCIVMINVWDII